MRVDRGGDKSTSSGQSMAFKIVMMGDKATGKSSIVVRFTKDQFSDALNTTIGAAFASKDVKVEDGTLVRMQMWDTAGEEMYRAMTRSFFRDAAAGIIVYDVTSRTSFESTKNWLKDFRDACPDAVAVLVGSKIDLEDLRRVPKADGSQFADSQEMPFFEVSAKTGARVGDIFQFVAQTLVARKRNRSAYA